MITRNVVRTLISALALCALVFFIISCSSGRSPVENLVREMSLCKSANHSASRPTNDPKLTDMVRSITGTRTPPGGVLLCTMPNQLYPTAESGTFLDGDKRATLVIWHEERLFKELDYLTTRFVLAHEFGHHVVGVACLTNERTYYVYCEHMVDRVAAREIGNVNSIYALERLLKYMGIRGANPPSVSLVKERIELLKKHSGD